MTLNKRFLFLLIFTPALVMIIAILSWFVYQRAEHISEEIDSYIESQNYLREVLTELLNAETGQRGYLLTEKEEFLQPYYRAIRTLKVSDSDYEKNKVDFALNDSQFNQLKKLTEDKFILMQLSISLHHSGNRSAALDLIKSGKGRVLMDSIRLLIEPSIVSLDKKLVRQQKLQNKYSLTVIVLISFALLFVCVMSYLFYQSVSYEIENRDAMNKAIEEKNKQLRDFTYQSYHQLKTPLRSIAGFLQLLQKRMGGSMDEDSKEMVRFSVDACEKMNEQIDEIRERYLNHP